MGTVPAASSGATTHSLALLIIIGGVLFAGLALPQSRAAFTSIVQRFRGYWYGPEDEQIFHGMSVEESVRRGSHDELESVDYSIYDEPEE